MTDINLQDRLEKANDVWGGAETKEGGGGSLPDGEYWTTINGFDFPESKWEPYDLQLQTEFVVSGGDFEGRVKNVWHTLENPERIGWTKGYLKMLGLDVDEINLAELPSLLEQVLDTAVLIRVKTTQKRVNGEMKSYTDVYVNEVGPKVDTLADTSDFTGRVGDGEPAGVGAADDDIPF